jgi:hypothetical protein
MSKVGRSLPNPSVGAPPDASPPPDLSGGGDIMAAPADDRSSRPGPAPKPIRESFSNPGMQQAPDVKMLNERAYDAKKTKVRNMALEQMPDLPVGKRLPGSAPLETEEAAPEAETVEPEATTEEPALDEKTAAQIAAKDRENRALRRKLKEIENSGQSDGKKLAKLRELAKTNPKGVADYLGMPFPKYIAQVRGDEEAAAVELDEAPAPTESEETENLRRENERLKAREQSRQAHEFVGDKVATSKNEDGTQRWPLMARVGDKATRAVVDTVLREIGKMKKLTHEQGKRVLEHFLDEKEAEYKAAQVSAPAPRGKQPPSPRAPQKVPAKAPMEFRHARDESDPRNRPNSREIAARLRAKLVGQ